MAQKNGQKRKLRPEQKQEEQPGRESKMTPAPRAEPLGYRGSYKLAEKVALITGGDSGIGKAVALLFAKEGADVAISYLSEQPDAEEVKKMVEEEFGQKCLLISGDIRKERTCEKIVNATIKEYGKLDILVNNAATQTEQKSLTDITDDQLYETFETNIISMFRITRYALPHLKKGASIINT